MSLVYSLKLLSDLVFYLTFAGLISALIGAQGREMGVGGFVSYLPFFVIAAAVLGTLASKKGYVKYLALLPLFGAITGAFNDGMIHLVLIAPAIVYTVYYATTLPYNIKTVSYSAVFRLYLILVLPMCIFFASNLSFFGAFLSGVIVPYLIMFAASSIILMRMIRHDTEILEHTRFKAMNSLSVAGVLLAGAALGSEQGIRTILTILSFIYFRMFIPILYYIILAIGAVLFPIFRLLGWEEWETTWPAEEEQQGDFDGWEDMMAYQHEAGIGYLIFQIVVFIGLGVLAFFLLRALFRFLTHKQIVRDSDHTGVSRVSLDEGRRLFRKREPRVTHQIRQIYRKFLKLCKNRGITLHPNLTTEDIARSFGESVGDYTGAKDLREIYIESRYGEKTPNSSHVKESKEIYNKLKKLGMTKK
ncbi:MAG: hypothetical protein FWE24_10640 [Defluviitaleaceae bacterium]|nr:hypothetical protein [Defluviitaleaceae bacterium]